MGLATVFCDRRRRQRRATRRSTISEQKKREGNDQQNKGHRKIRDGTEEDPAIMRARVMNPNSVLTNALRGQTIDHTLTLHVPTVATVATVPNSGGVENAALPIGGPRRAQRRCHADDLDVLD
jgi:hypothetical protein